MTRRIFAATALLTLSLIAFGRGADKPTVTGKWHFVFDTQGGDREYNSALEQSGDQVGGKWAMSDTRPGADVKGTFTDGQLLLDFPVVSDEVGAGSLKIKGHLAEDGSMTGQWMFGEYDGSFKATRIKDDAAK
jgi:hypothetical protein